MFLWDAATGKQRASSITRPRLGGWPSRPTAGRFFTGTGGDFIGNPTVLVINPGDDNLIRLWDAKDGRLIRAMSGHTHAVYTLDFSPDGRIAASGGWDGTVRLWDLETGDELHKIEGWKRNVMRVLFSPDGKQLFVGAGVLRGCRGIP